MGTQRFSIDPAAFSNASSQTRHVADRINETWTTLSSGLAGLGEPWGTDKTGSQFANGQNGSGGYLSTVDNVRTGITGPQGYVTSVNNLADGIDSASAYYQKMETDNTESF